MWYALPHASHQYLAPTTLLFSLLQFPYGLALCAIALAIPFGSHVLIAPSVI